jgi:hypothetical protein
VDGLHAMEVVRRLGERARARAKDAARGERVVEQEVAGNERQWLEP